MTSDHKAPLDVLVLVLRGDRLLLTMRAGGIYGAGQWALPSGSVEADEDAVSAARRELAEELRLHLEPEDLAFVGVTHARPPHGEARVGFGFAVTRPTPDPVIAEPDKCAALRWWPIEALPDATMAYTRELVRLYLTGHPFSVAGWPGNPASTPV